MKPWPNQADRVNAPIASWFQVGHSWRRVAEQRRSVRHCTHRVQTHNGCALKGHDSTAQGKRACWRASPWVSVRNYPCPEGARVDRRWQAIFRSSCRLSRPVGASDHLFGVLPRATLLADSELALGCIISPPLGSFDKLRAGCGHRTRRWRRMPTPLRCVGIAQLSLGGSNRKSGAQHENANQS